MKMKKFMKKILPILASGVIALGMAVSAIPNLSMIAYAAEVNAPSEGTYWTKDQLSELGDSSTGTPYYATGTTFQKANYGGKEWYAIGGDNGSLVMLSPSAIGGSNVAFDSGGSTDYSSSTIKSKLNSFEGSEAYSVGQLFSTEEQAKITNTSMGKLYLPDGNDQDSSNFKVGSSNQFSIPIQTWANKNTSHGVQNFFWLRSALTTDALVFCVSPNGSVRDCTPDGGGGSVVPAFNLNLSSVLFSSAAPAASSQGITKSEVVANSTMTFRFTDSDKIKSTVTYYGSKATVAKDSGDSNLYLCVQYNDGTSDKIYTKAITSSGDVDLSSVGSDLSNAKIWLEKRDGNLVYAKMATAGSDRSDWPTELHTDCGHPDSSVIHFWTTGETYVEKGTESAEGREFASLSKLDYYKGQTASWYQGERPNELSKFEGEKVEAKTWYYFDNASMKFKKCVKQSAPQPQANAGASVINSFELNKVSIDGILNSLSESKFDEFSQRMFKRTFNYFSELSFFQKMLLVLFL